MSVKSEKEEALKRKTLHVAAKMFLDKGYLNSTTRGIANEAGINISTMNRIFGAKEGILAELVKMVLEWQFIKTKEMLQDKTDDKILFYAAETTLQLYITENSEHIRELYAAAYSLPMTTDIIQHTITGKLEGIFKEHLPDLETKDFFELEIASGGIMRGFMTMPCDMYFTMDRKVRRFLEATFRVYCVPDEKIQDAIKFVSQFNYPKIAQETIDSMLSYLEDKIS